MLKTLGIVVLVIVIALIGVGFYLGIFSSVKIEKAAAGPYTIASLDHIGPYKNICAKIKNAKKLLDEQAVIALAPCGLYYDDPKTVASDKLRSRGGYIIEDNVKLEILEKQVIPSREVVLARVKAHPMIAAIKVYPKIEKYLTKNNLTITGPCFEIYNENGVVEVQVPIAEKKA